MCVVNVINDDDGDRTEKLFEAKTRFQKIDKHDEDIDCCTEQYTFRLSLSFSSVFIHSFACTYRYCVFLPQL